MEFTKRITVFTPTYNRAYIIENLYRSLQRQTFTDFEWLVVDDGSVDNTKQLFEVWMQEENPFPIRYYQQKNGGKCRAINRGLELAQGELFFTVDSDDHLTADALEKIVCWESGLPKNQKFCGIAGNLGTAPDCTPNTLFSEPYLDGTAFSRYAEVDGERAMIFYTEIHRKYLYPGFEGENFMTEAIAWNRMANDGYKIRFFNDIIWIYEYKEDGLTKAGETLFYRNPRGYGLFFREKIQFLNYSLREKWDLRISFIINVGEMYPTKLVAEAIGLPVGVVAAMKAVRNLKHGILRKDRG